jgi:integrase
MGVLHLVATGPGRLPKDHPFAPVKLYLDSLSPGGGVRAQRVNLERCARLLTGTRGASLSDFDWRSLSFADVEAVRSRLRLDGYSASVINGTLSALKRVARYAWRLEQMSSEEHERIRDVGGVRAGHRVRPVRALSPEEIAALLEACDHAGGAAGARDACLIALMYGGGLRRSEARSLNLADYTARTHTLKIVGKGGRDRFAYFDSGGARRAINLWRRVRGPAQGPLLCPVRKDGAVHVTERLSPSAIYAALDRRAAQAGIAHFSPHALRRAFATHLLDTDEIDLATMQALMGHASPVTTVIYDQRGEKSKRRAAKHLSVPFRTGASVRGGGKRRRGRRRGSNWKAQLRAKL